MGGAARGVRRLQLRVRRGGRPPSGRRMDPGVRLGRRGRAAPDPGPLVRGVDEGRAMRVWPGTPYPLGATWDGEGVNFALFSEHATGVQLCLFDHPDDAK